jgi:hypothetical protein
LKAALWIQTKRVLRNDFTVFHGGKVYQVLDKIGTKYVTVQERVDGTLLIADKERLVKFHRIPQAKLVKRQSVKQENTLKQNRTFKSPRSAIRGELPTNGIANKKSTNKKADISKLLKRGHFYFALTISLCFLDKLKTAILFLRLSEKGLLQRAQRISPCAPCSPW